MTLTLQAALDEMRRRQEVLARIAGHPALTEAQFLEVRDEWLAIQRRLLAVVRDHRFPTN